MLFNRDVKRIHEFVLVTLFEATCKRRAVSEVQNRVPATSRSGQILSVRAMPIFFAGDFWSRSMPLSPQVREKIIEKEAFAPGDKAELGRNFAPSATLDRV